MLVSSHSAPRGDGHKTPAASPELAHRSHPQRVGVCDKEGVPSSVTRGRPCRESLPGVKPTRKRRILFHKLMPFHRGTCEHALSREETWKDPWAPNPPLGREGGPVPLFLLVFPGVFWLLFPGACAAFAVKSPEIATGTSVGQAAVVSELTKALGLPLALSDQLFWGQASSERTTWPVCAGQVPHVSQGREESRRRVWGGREVTNTQRPWRVRPRPGSWWRGEVTQVVLTRAGCP